MIQRSRHTPSTTSQLSGGECAEGDCDRPVWRQGLCASHFKRKQRGQTVAGPIGESVMPGGLRMGEVPSLQDLFLVVAGDYVDCDSENDAEFERAWGAAKRWAIKFAHSKGMVTSKEALDLAQSLGWSPPVRRTDRARRTHHHRRRQYTQLELPFTEFFHEPNWADEVQRA